MKLNLRSTVSINQEPFEKTFLLKSMCFLEDSVAAGISILVNLAVNGTTFFI